MGLFSKIKKFWDVDSKLDEAVARYQAETGQADLPCPRASPRRPSPPRRRLPRSPPR